MVRILHAQSVDDEIYFALQGDEYGNLYGVIANVLENIGWTEIGRF